MRFVKQTHIIRRTKARGFLMRQSDFIGVRITPNIRGALEQIGGPGGISRAVRAALAEYVQRNRKNDAPPAPQIADRRQ